jgi:hypothetical protein
MVNATQENRIDPLDPADVFKAEASLRRQIGKMLIFSRIIYLDLPIYISKEAHRR